MKFKEQLRTIYWFLNNTTGKIEEFQLKYLIDCYIDYYDIRVYSNNLDDFKKISNKDLQVLNSYIETGEKDDEFIKYIVNWGSNNEF